MSLVATSVLPGVCRSIDPENMQGGCGVLQQDEFCCPLHGRGGSPKSTLMKKRSLGGLVFFWRKDLSLRLQVRRISWVAQRLQRIQKVYNRNTFNNSSLIQ